MDIVEMLTYLLESGRSPNHEETCRAIAEIKRLRSLVGAASDGQGMADLKLRQAQGLAAHKRANATADGDALSMLTGIQSESLKHFD